MTERQKLQAEYFNTLDKQLEGTSVGPATSGKRNYRCYAFPKLKCHLDALIQIDDRALQVGLRMRSRDREEIFEALNERKNEIEATLGYPLTWDKKEKREHCWIYVERIGPNPANRNDWPNQHRWIRRQLDGFLTVFIQHMP